MTELWALLHWLYPEVFTVKTSEMFRAAFDLTKGQVNTSFMDDARRLLELIMLRRMKNSPSVNLKLPPKEEVLLYVPLTPMQRYWYKRLLTRTDKGLLEELFQNAKNKELEALKVEQVEDALVAETKKTSREASGSQGSNADSLKENGSGNQENEDEWAETKAILQRTREMENQDQGKSPAWQKLMNLLMQLRKVSSATNRADMSELC